MVVHIMEERLTMAEILIMVEVHIMGVVHIMTTTTRFYFNANLN